LLLVDHRGSSHLIRFAKTLIIARDMRWLHGVMAAIFLFSAVLQLNDPDPAPWVAIYLAAGGLAALAAAGCRPPWRRPAAVILAGIAVAWALAIAFTSPEVPPLRALVGDWGMRAAGIEERRETLGLLLLALWAAVVALPGRNGPPSGHPR
jgi:hypothetical protein